MIMNTIRKFAAIVLALTLSLAMGSAALAAETVTNNTDHSYEVYQIFQGTQAAGEATGKLAVTDWGNGINGDAFLAALKAGNQFGAPNIFANAATALDVAEALAGHTQYADAFAALAHAHKTGIPTEIPSNAASVELAAGYYLLVDTTDVTGAGDAKNISLLQVTQHGAVTIEKKYSVPTVKKKVKDVSDTDGEATGWQDSADYDIGDKVPFQLTGTLPSNLEDYETYFYQFNDTLSSGLTYDESSLTVKLDGNDVTSRFDINYAGDKLTVKCDDVKALSNINYNSTIVVEYTATLNANAVIGSAGNKNAVNLEFSNNPNAGGEGEKGKTPDDTVIVFTYKVVVNKTDENNAPLTGAEFTLFKQVSGGQDKELAAVKNEDGTTFTFSGLDDGSYVLRETKVPAGYNKIADIAFSVTAEHDITSDDPKLTSLTGNVTTGEITFASDITAGALSTTIINKSGATLPETGGIGTIIFYVLGAALVAVAGVLLVSKKRMNE